MKKLIIANWKMNPQTVDEARRLVASFEHRMHAVSGHTEVVICPPFVYLPAFMHYIHQLKLGAQNVSFVEHGAMTGEISPAQIKQWNVEYVILGHSERRLYLGETDSIVNAKISTVLKYKMTPVVCLGGEEGATRDGMKELVTRQFAKVTKNLQRREIEKIVFVYEPVWAISTMRRSQPATGEHANAMIEHIYDLLGKKVGHHAAANIRVLYGGTVNKDNVGEYAKYPKIDGALVGAAALEPDNFWQVVSEFNRESIHHA
ncbi:MAG: triose-phosphate isomerase [Candidatus Doudnabacteria bacterium]|nr:triose-phosphate isomerase [Candidatus Doudnabacteria bacterium]